MARRNLQNYCGARSRIDLRDARDLGSQWVLQPKIDGAYCQLHLDESGAVDRLVSRTGRDFSDSSLAASFLGIRIGWPGAVLAGEVEAHTEASNAAAKLRGYRKIHLFDMVQSAGGRPLEREEYGQRRDLMHRMVADISTGEEVTVWRDGSGRMRSTKTGRFSTPEPRDFRRFEIVPQYSARAACSVWDRYVGELQGEGLVAVNLRSKLGAKGSKRKIKHTETHDGTVVAVDGKSCSVKFGASVFSVGVGKVQPKRGQVVEFVCDGWYVSGITPRFPRLVRVRHDLAQLSHRAN